MKLNIGLETILTSKRLPQERRKDGHDGHHQQQQHHPGQHPQVSGGARKHENTEEILWDWQAASLLLAIIGCLMFFFAAAIIALNQTRQWKRIEKHFDAGKSASIQSKNYPQQMSSNGWNWTHTLHWCFDGGGGGGGESATERERGNDPFALPLVPASGALFLLRKSHR